MRGYRTFIFAACISTLPAVGHAAIISSTNGKLGQLVNGSPAAIGGTAAAPSVHTGGVVSPGNDATPFTAYISGIGEDPAQHLFGLMLSDSSGAIAPTDAALLSTIVNDINGRNGNLPAVGVTASLVTGSYTSLFPGYDILLKTDSSVTSDQSGIAKLEFAFPSIGEMTLANGNITITNITIPEPATGSMIALGASAMLMRRRWRR